MKVNIKKLDARAKLPEYGSAFAAGDDLYALLDEQLTVAPGETAFVHTGLALELPMGCMGLVYARSGMACKRDLAPANKVGVIDCDYRGEIIVAMHNNGKQEQMLEPEERIAKLIIAPYITVKFEETDELEDTERGCGGFGSTGSK